MALDIAIDEVVIPNDKPVDIKQLRDEVAAQCPDAKVEVVQAAHTETIVDADGSEHFEFFDTVVKVTGADVATVQPVIESHRPIEKPSVIIPDEDFKKKLLLALVDSEVTKVIQGIKVSDAVK